MSKLSLKDWKFDIVIGVDKDDHLEDEGLLKFNLIESIEKANEFRQDVEKRFIEVVETFGLPPIGASLYLPDVNSCTIMSYAFYTVTKEEDEESRQVYIKLKFL